MVEVISVATGTIILYFAMKYIFVKEIIGVFTKIFTNKYILIGILLGLLGYLLFPQLFTPYIDIILNWFFNSLVGLWELIDKLVKTIIGKII